FRAPVEPARQWLLVGSGVTSPRATVAPVATVTPVAPEGPVGPIPPAPVAPGAPWSPVRPVPPGAPVGPVDPAAPLRPVGPAVPCGFVRPVACPKVTMSLGALEGTFMLARLTTVDAWGRWQRHCSCSDSPPIAARDS